MIMTGKRKIVVVSSSDDEDGDRSRNRTRSTSMARTAVTRRKFKSSEKAFVSGTQFPKKSHKTKEVDFNFISEDFCKIFQRVPDESRRKLELSSEWRSPKEAWVDKYRPRSLAGLSVHRKKVEEVKLWLEERLRTPKEGFNHALVITGQTGVGKSATVHVIASQLGAELCEWNTPTPTLWQEYIHNGNSEIRYISKLDEFETFAERIRKYPLLPSASDSRSRKSVILLIDDLPVTNGRASFARLSQCLCLLSQSTPFPTIILITEYSKSESGNGTSDYYDELISSLEKAGAFKVSFNPLTTNSIRKTLSRICKAEMCAVPVEWIDHISEGSGGDIRNAIMSLQYFCLKPSQLPPVPLSKRIISVEKPNGGNASVKGMEDLDDILSLTVGRDGTLSLFHALGKFLHNKRDTEHGVDLGQDLFYLHERFVRFPLKMDAPEKVLCQAHGEPRSITDFLHENVLDFISDEAINDASTVTSYLSDADCLIASTINQPTRSLMIRGKYDLQNIAQLVASSVAARGVLFGNSHPSLSRWHSMRRPKLWQVEQSSRRNKNQIMIERFQAYSCLSSSGLSAMATEYKPIWKWLGSRVSDCLEDESDWTYMDLDDIEGEEDAIEDW